MLDFRAKTKSKKTPYGPETSRWLWLVFFLGVVLIIGERAMHPEVWQFIARGLIRGGENAQRSEPPIDNRLTPPTGDHPPGMIVLSAPSGEPSSEGSLAPGVKGFQVFTREQLEEIQDDSPLRRAEMEAWRQTLQVLHETDQAVLQGRSVGMVSYGQLFRQSGAYRGRLVTVRGQLRRAHRVGMPNNPWGQDYYYQTWLQPADNPYSPMQIYCLELPEGFPLGMDIREEVEITGVYFKRAAYQAHDGLRTAPTLVAKTLQWLPRPALVPQATPPGGATLLIIVVGVALLGVGAAVGMYYRVRPKPRFEIPRVMQFPNSEDPTSPDSGAPVLRNSSEEEVSSE